MKLVDFFEDTFNISRTNFMNIEDDKFSQAGGEKKRKPVITLRHVNKLKKMKAAQMEEMEKRRKLFGFMYSTPRSTEE